MKAKPIVISAPGEGQVKFGSQVDPELRAAMEAGRPVCVFARTSGSGSGGRVATALDAEQLAGDLARFGIDITHLLPTAEQVNAWLKAAPPLRSISADNGTEFTNRFVEYWITPTFLFGMSLGSGSRMSEETISQPFVDYVNARVMAERPVLLMGKRWDRVARRKWGLGPSMEVLKACQPGFLGDEEGIKRLDETAELLAFIKGSEAEKFAKNIPRQTRRGMRSRTGEALVDGGVAYALQVPPPPGFCRLRMLSGGVGANGASMMYLESSRWMPARSQVAIGYPTLTDPSTGEIVDQVENVRWALQKLADPEWTLEKIGEGLRLRKFSHTALRERRGLDAIVGADIPAQGAGRAPRLAKLVSTIVNNLDVYETGTLVRTLGVKDMDDVVITNLFPLDGPWASQDTFTRIRKRLRERQGRRKNTVMHLTGLPVIVDGSEYVLRGSHPEDEEPSYALGIRGSRRFPGVKVRLPHSMLARCVAEALDSAVANGLSVPSLDADLAETPVVAQAIQKVESLEILITDARQRSELLFKRTLDESIGGPAAKRFSDEYNTMLEETIPALERDLRYARESLAMVEEEAIANRGVTTERLDYLIRSLAEPLGNNIRKEVASLVHSLKVSLERHVPHRNLPGYIAHVDIELALLDANGDVFVFPFTKSYPMLGAAKFEQQLDSALTDLRDGSAAENHEWLKGFSIKMDDLARILELENPRKQVLYMKDARIQRATFAVIEAVRAGASDKAEQVAGIAARLGEPEALVSRCWDLYGPEPAKQGRWRKSTAPRDNTLRVCPHGCEVLMLQSLIDEIHGGVCPECRLDLSGVEWGEKYARWLVQPEPRRRKAA